MIKYYIILDSDGYFITESPDKYDFIIAETNDLKTAERLLHLELMRMD